MTRAKRLLNLLQTVKEKESKQLLSIWKEIFEVTDIFEVYSRLIYVKKEIEEFESELIELNISENQQFKDTLQTLNLIVGFPSLNSRIDNQQSMKNENINIVFGSFSIYQSILEAQHIQMDLEKDIDKDEFEEFKKGILNVIKEIEKSDMEDSDKEIFLSIFHDLNKGISLYKINGINSFVEVIKNNFCKIQMIVNSEPSSKTDKFKQLTKYYISKSYIWTKSVIKKKIINSIEYKGMKMIDESITGWGELPKPDDSEIIEADIEETDEEE